MIITEMSSLPSQSTDTFISALIETLFDLTCKYKYIYYNNPTNPINPAQQILYYYCYYYRNLMFFFILIHIYLIHYYSLYDTFTN